MQMIEMIYSIYKFIRASLRSLGTVISDPIIYLKNAPEKEKALLHSALLGKVTFTDDDKAANIVIISLTNAAGVTYANNRLVVYLPIRNGSNDAVADASIDTLIKVMQYLWK